MVDIGGYIGYECVQKVYRVVTLKKEQKLGPFLKVKSNFMYSTSKQKVACNFEPNPYKKVFSFIYPIIQCKQT